MARAGDRSAARAAGFELVAGDAASPLVRALPAFRPRMPWLGGDLQTLRNSLLPIFRRGAKRVDRLEIPLRDSAAGCISAAVDLPRESASAGPLILLVHGLGGCESSPYNLLTAPALTRAGHTVLRLNLRGAGPAALTSRGPYHAGLTSDLRDALSALAERWPGRPVLAVGFSLGGHLLLKLACERAIPTNLAGTVSLSAPLDLAAAERRMASPRNRLYQWRIVAWMKRDARRWLDGGESSGSRLAGITRIRDFDREIVVPAHGFSSVEDYYAAASVLPDLGRLSVPALAIHAGDDPWISGTVYRRAPWPRSSEATVILTRSGGHVGFHGRHGAQPWYVDAILHFSRRLSAGGERRAAESTGKRPAGASAPKLSLS